VSTRYSIHTPHTFRLGPEMPGYAAVFATLLPFKTNNPLETSKKTIEEYL
jgi:hypothetical protein